MPSIAVIDSKVEWQSAHEIVALEAFRGVRGMENAPDFGREYELLTRLLAQEMADAVFALAVAVEGGRVEIAHAHIPGGLQ